MMEIRLATTADLPAILAIYNAASYRLHRSLGFVEVAHFREVGYKFGRWLDLKFLELLLEPPREPRE